MMFITRKRLSRRTILRGAGAAIALPMLDSMVPALARAGEAPARVARFLPIYAPMGVNMAQWTPAREGALELSPILQTIAPFKKNMIVVSHLDSREAARVVDAGVHPRAQAVWSTGCRAKPTEGTDIYLGVSADQLAARQFESATQLGSLELSLEIADTINGGCAVPEYTCAYSNSIAWRTPTMPLMPEPNPRAVFERLFGASESTDSTTRRAQLRKERSILEAVHESIAKLRGGLGPKDQARMDDYLDSIRDIERRIQKAEEQADRELPAFERPRSIPPTFGEHAAIMFELLVLTFQADLTRVVSLMLGHELSNRTFPEIGFTEPWHPVSHHANDPQKLAMQAKLNTYHLRLFADFLERMRTTTDGAGPLLDSTVIMYGSGMSNSNLHLHLDLPTMVVGGQGLGLRGDRHLAYPKGTPLANLQLTLLQKLGVPVDRFGDSTGTLSDI